MSVLTGDKGGSPSPDAPPTPGLDLQGCGGLEDLNFAVGLAAKDGAGGCPADVPPAPQRPAPADKEPFRRLSRPARRRQG